MGRRPKTYKNGFRQSHESKPKIVYHCARCGQDKIKAQMMHDRKRGSHHQVGSWCKDCQRDYMKEYRQTHQDQIKAKQQEKYRRRRAYFYEN